MSAFVVCGACHDIRGGPIGEVDGVEVLQLCGCSSTTERMMTVDDQWHAAPSPEVERTSSKSI